MVVLPPSLNLYTDTTKRIMGKPDLINIHELITIAILTSKIAFLDISHPFSHFTAGYTISV